MRQVGDILGRRRADRFVGFLTAQGIKAELRDEGADRFVIWVINEDDMPAADEHYRAYRAAPEAPVFDVVAPPSAPPKSLAPARRSRYIDVRTEVFGRPSQSMQVTIALIGLSILTTLLMNVPQFSGLTHWLYYAEPNLFGPAFFEVAHGQLWRLVTPIFMHQGLMHLLFNMMFMYQLGGAIEGQEGSRYLALLVLATAVIVDTAQYLVSGPLFIGMSGVVYALFGYVWIMSRYQIGSRYHMAEQTVYWMIGWIFICLFGWMPGAANTEHICGLLVGVLWGFVRSGYARTWLRQRRPR